MTQPILRSHHTLGIFFLVEEFRKRSNSFGSFSQKPKMLGEDLALYQLFLEAPSFMGP